MTTLSPELRERVENTIRFLSVDAVQRANSGHPGAPMGLARVALELWDRHLRFDPTDPAWPLRDRFVLSNGHASMLIYSLLHLFGYDVSHQDLADFRKLGSKTPGHPEYGDTPGVEMTTGPLGQGFAHGVGMALAGRATRARFGGASDGPGHHFVYGIVGDGDLMEGISAEAGSLAGHWGLGNLIYLYDDNQITIDGGTDLSFTENVRGRFEAQGWQVLEADGQDYDAVNEALVAARAETERPSLIITRTTIGFGSPKVAGTSKAHGAPLGAGGDQARPRAKLGWPTEAGASTCRRRRSKAYCQRARRRAKRAAAQGATMRRSLRGARRQRHGKAAAWDEARARKRASRSSRPSSPTGWRRRRRRRRASTRQGRAREAGRELVPSHDRRFG